MAVAVNFTDVWTDGRRIHAIGTLTITGNYAAGGDALDIKGAKGGLDHKFWRSNKDPLWVDARGKAGFVYAYDKATKKLMTFFGDNNNAADGPLVELPAAAYPAGVTGDVIDFYAVGKR